MDLPKFPFLFWLGKSTPDRVYKGEYSLNITICSRLWRVEFKNWFKSLLKHNRIPTRTRRPRRRRHCIAFIKGWMMKCLKRLLHQQHQSRHGMPWWHHLRVKSRFNNVRLQTLCRPSELLQMELSETFSDNIARVLAMTNHMKQYGEDHSEQAQGGEDLKDPNTQIWAHNCGDGNKSIFV